MYSTHKRENMLWLNNFIRTLKTKIYKYMTSILENVYIDKLSDIVNEYNNVYHRTITMKPVDVKGNTCVGFNKEGHDKGRKFNVGDHVRISKYKSTFAKGYTPNWSEDFVISKVKNTVSWTYVISDLNGEELIGAFYEKELQKKKAKKNLG